MLACIPRRLAFLLVTDLYILRYQASVGALGVSQAITLRDKPWLQTKVMVHEAAVLSHAL